MTKEILYLRDTYFFEAVEYLKKKKQLASIMLLHAFNEKATKNKNLNEIGQDVLKTTGENKEVAQIIQKYANITAD